MPVTVRIAPQKMTQDDYEQMMRELEERGHGDPPGRLSHASHGDETVHMEETWETREEFEAHQERRLAVLDAAGFDAGIINVSEFKSHLISHPARLWLVGQGLIDRAGLWATKGPRPGERRSAAR